MLVMISRLLVAAVFISLGITAGCFITAKIREKFPSQRVIKKQIEKQQRKYEKEVEKEEQNNIEQEQSNIIEQEQSNIIEQEQNNVEQEKENNIEQEEQEKTDEQIPETDIPVKNIPKKEWEELFGNEEELPDWLIEK